jgi:hypothetical protein
MGISQVCTMKTAEPPGLTQGRMPIAQGGQKSKARRYSLFLNKNRSIPEKH